MASVVNPMASDVNPMASVVNPMASVVNPMASDVNPMASVVNPVTSDVNPMALDVNPVTSDVNPVIYTITSHPDTTAYHKFIKKCLKEDDKEIKQVKLSSSIPHLIGHNFSLLKRWYRKYKNYPNVFHFLTLGYIPIPIDKTGIFANIRKMIRTATRTATENPHIELKAEIENINRYLCEE